MVVSLADSAFVKKHARRMHISTFAGEKRFLSRCLLSSVLRKWDIHFVQLESWPVVRDSLQHAALKQRVKIRLVKMDVADMAVAGVIGTGRRLEGFQIRLMDVANYPGREMALLYVAVRAYGDHRHAASATPAFCLIHPAIQVKQGIQSLIEFQRFPRVVIPGMPVGVQPEVDCTGEHSAHPVQRIPMPVQGHGADAES